ncbi:MAG: hypothetical protein FJX78_10530, partial [Armatimonadetes bacterium]|nr:hypothetical protein [Armatimonadota bacterium]
RWFARLRYRLIPYLYSTALDAAETGLPVMRAMVLDHPDEPGMTLADGQYYLGDSLLVAPMARADGQVTILLPPGRWLDYNSGDVTSGGQVTRVCALDEMPLFLPEDRMLPLGPVRSWIGGTSAEPASADPGTVDVFVRDRASFRLRGDDFARVLEARRAGDAITFESSDAGALEARFHRTGQPVRIVADGVSVPCVEDNAAYRASASAWRVEGDAAVVKTRARAGSRRRDGNLTDRTGFSSVYCVARYPSSRAASAA